MDDLSDSLNKLISRQTEGDILPGIVYGLANRDGVICEGAAGYRNIETHDPMLVDTIIEIASMTKPVTSVAVLQLYEKGQIQLDAPASDYLPELAELQVLDGYDNAGEPILRKPASLPTVSQLLTHTSGFVYEIWNKSVALGVASGKLPSMLGSDGDRLKAPLAFDPGSRWEYGIGIDWAGLLVEKLSGQALDDYFEAHIFSVLDMADTFFSVPEQKSPRRASIHRRGEDGLVSAPSFPPSVGGGGGLQSTVSDYIKFMRCILNGGALNGKQILNSETTSLMFENHIGEINVGSVETQAADLSADFDLTFNRRAKWSLGFLLHEEPTESGRVAGTVSWAGLFNSFFWIDRQNDLCAVVATQLLPFCDTSAVEMLTSFEEAVYSYLGDKE